jgi:carbon monoxide dehydrogenase subunit G
VELTNEFTVGVPPERAFAILTDVERIAPCLPGAELHEVAGEEYRGVVKVKVGPITAEYKGKASFLEKDERAGRVVLRADGRDTRGQGNAAATVTATMRGEEGRTRVEVTTDLTVTGRVAQFGRGVLAEVSTKLLGQFVECLEATVLAEERAGAGGDGSGRPLEVAGPASQAAGTERAAGPGPERTEADRASHGAGGESADAGPERTAEVRVLRPGPAEPVDLLEVAGPSVAKRLVPLALALLAAAGVVALWRRRRR